MSIISRIIFLSVLIFFGVDVNCTYAQIRFPLPDTVCGGQPQTISNPLATGVNTYWNSCADAIAAIPTGVNLGNPGGLINGPAYVTLVKDGADYYVFVCNHFQGTIIRLFYGTSLMNVPVVYNLGRLGNALPQALEGIQFRKDNGIWYGIVIGGNGSSTAHTSRLVVIDFGPSIANNTPVATNLGNVNNTLDYPMDIKVFREGTDWLAFVTNFYDHTITRLNFGNSFTNVPTAVNLGNLGTMSNPSGICEVRENNNWYFLISNTGNHTLTRLSFGTSLLNTPSAVNLGNIGNQLNEPKDMQFLRTCDGLFGFVLNENANHVIRVKFAGDTITGFATAVNLGNIGGMNRTHPMSDFFRDGDVLYSLLGNINNHTLTRLEFNSCTLGSVFPSTTVATPQVTFPAAAGSYPVNQFLNEGLPDQTVYCGKMVVVTPAIDSVQLRHPSYCNGDDGSLIVYITQPNVNVDVRYEKDGIAVATQLMRAGSGGEIIIPNLESASYDSIYVTFRGCESLVTGPFVLEGPRTAEVLIESEPAPPFCVGDTIIIRSAGVHVVPAFQWNTGAQTPDLRVTQSGTYILKVTDGPCEGEDTMVVVFQPVHVFDLGIDTAICENVSLKIGAPVTPGVSWIWNTGDSTPVIEVSAGMYILEADLGGCSTSDTISINLLPAPSVRLPVDRHICRGYEILLDAGNPTCRYLWSTGDTSRTIIVREPGLYHVAVVSPDGCIGSDSIILTALPDPVVRLGADTSVCEETPLILAAKHEYAESLTWSTAATSSSISVTAGGMYVLSASNACATVSDTIYVDQIFCDIWVPNAFSPNGDGVNDVFRVLGNIGRLSKFGLSVYNRWGQRVFHTMDRYTGWDGRQDGGEALLGTYIYVVEYELAGKPVLLKGNFHLLR